MVKGEGLCGLRAKGQGGTRRGRWGHGLLWALACACLADDRTAATCWVPLKGAFLGDVYVLARRRSVRGFFFWTDLISQCHKLAGGKGAGLRGNRLGTRAPVARRLAPLDVLCRHEETCEHKGGS